MFKRSVMLVIAGIVLVSLGIMLLFMPSFSTKKDKAAPAKLAVIHVEGVILGGRGQSSLFSEIGGIDQVIRQLHEARDDQSIKAIVLRINSPGGSVPATQELGEEIKKVRAGGKPIIVSMGDVAASGGYWLAALADKVYANPSTLTGSIGVYMPYSNWEELYQKIGVRQEKIKSGPHKDILSPERQITPEERAIVQTMVDDMYNQFVEVVAEGRKLDPARVRQIADGRIYTGKQAKELGLVDELGNFYDAIDGAAQIAGITGKPQLKEFGKINPWDVLFGAEGKINLQQILTQQIKNDLPLTAPLAMPERW